MEDNIPFDINNYETYNNGGDIQAPSETEPRVTIDRIEEMEIQSMSIKSSLAPEVKKANAKAAREAKQRKVREQKKKSA